MADPIIELRNAGVSFSIKDGLIRRRKKWALRQLDLDIYAGETLGVIGPNGVGKSTLLRLLAGIILPSEGRMTKSKHLDVALLAIKAGFVPHLSGRENAILGGILMGMGKAEMKSKVDSIFEYAELQEVIDEQFSSYSSGMQLRLGFAVALCAEPEVLLIDEALGVGDASFKRKSAKTLRDRINSDQTVILVSHSANEIGQLCQRALYLRSDGNHQVGEAKHMLEVYLNSS